MLKYTLHEKGFAEQERIPNGSMIAFMWFALTLIMLAATAVALLWLTIDLGIGDYGIRDPLGFISSIVMLLLAPLGPAAFAGLIIFWLFFFILLHLGLKLVLTIAVCCDKHRSIKLKMLKSKAMPICECKEAIKVWQIVVTHLIPFFLVYAVVFILFLVTGMSNFYYGAALFITVFYGAFDITLVVSVLHIKITERVDYISIDHHVYAMTLFSKAYIRENKKTSKVRRFLKMIKRFQL